jgi:hypothetical protein
MHRFSIGRGNDNLPLTALGAAQVGEAYSPTNATPVDQALLTCAEVIGFCGLRISSSHTDRFNSKLE